MKYTPQENPLNKIVLTVRAANVLQTLAVLTVEDASRLTVYDMLRIRQCGRKTAAEIVKALLLIGIKIPDAHLLDPTPESVQRKCVHCGKTHSCKP